MRAISRSATAQDKNSRVKLKNCVSDLTLHVLFFAIDLDQLIFACVLFCTRRKQVGPPPLNSHAEDQSDFAITVVVQKVRGLSVPRAPGR